MIKLDSNNYYKVIPLLNEINYNHLFARIVVNKKASGCIYVDNDQKPTVCIIIHKYGMAFLCGNYNNDSFNKDLIKFLKSNSINKPKWILVYPANWERKLDSLLGNDLISINDDTSKFDIKKSFIKTERVNFKFDSCNYNYNIIPQGFVLKRINSTIYSNIIGSVVPKYFWDSEEEFLNKGVGYTLLYNNQIVSTCFASYMDDNIIELGIETSEEYRKQGYSVYPAYALIEYCQKNGYELMWSCRKENISSFKVALKLGFTPHSYHPYYCVLGK